MTIALSGTIQRNSVISNAASISINLTGLNASTLLAINLMWARNDVTINGPTMSGGDTVNTTACSRIDHFINPDHIYSHWIFVQNVQGGASQTLTVPFSSNFDQSCGIAVIPLSGCVKSGTFVDGNISDSVTSTSSGVILTSAMTTTAAHSCIISSVDSDTTPDSWSGITAGYTALRNSVNTWYPSTYNSNGGLINYDVGVAGNKPFQYNMGSGAGHPAFFNILALLNGPPDTGLAWIRA